MVLIVGVVSSLVFVVLQVLAELRKEMFDILISDARSWRLPYRTGLQLRMGSWGTAQRSGRSIATRPSALDSSLDAISLAFECWMMMLDVAFVRLISAVLLLPSLYDFFKFIGAYDESLQVFFSEMGSLV